MAMKTGWLSILVVMFAMVPVRAQSPQPDPAPVLEAMKAVAFLEGRWAGQGWIQMGPGPKEEFSQTEVVERKLDGGLLLIEGIGRSRAAEPTTVHHAFAVVSFDPSSKKYRFSSHIVGRPPLDIHPEVGSNTFKWSYEPQPSVHIRYLITVADATWREVGEFSRDGKTWRQFFEMTLKRQ
jgi:hypothetical protein